MNEIIAELVAACKELLAAVRDVDQFEGQQVIPEHIEERAELAIHAADAIAGPEAVAEEREACAKIAETLFSFDKPGMTPTKAMAGLDIAAHIRKRGKT